MPSDKVSQSSVFRAPFSCWREWTVRGHHLEVSPVKTFRDLQSFQRKKQCHLWIFFKISNIFNAKKWWLVSPMKTFRNVQSENEQWLVSPVKTFRNFQSFQRKKRWLVSGSNRKSTPLSHPVVLSVPLCHDLTKPYNVRIRVSHSYWFWYERRSEYICNKNMIQTNIRIYLYQTYDRN